MTSGGSVDDAATQTVVSLVEHDVLPRRDGALRLIDWEYAGVGQRLFDLASVCVYHKYDKLQREQLLVAYTSLTELTTWHRLELACWLFDYVRDLWMAVRESG